MERVRPAVVGICGSTGGPRVLVSLLPALRPVIETVPVLLVQHVLDGFDAALCRWLRDTTGVAVQLAGDGDRLRPGTVLMAPDGKHMLASSRERVQTTDDPPHEGHRPSGTLLFRSLARSFGSETIGVMLSGMGEDGLDGLRDVKGAGGVVLAQEPDSCVVASMPAAAIAEGLPEVVLGPDALGEYIATAVQSAGGADEGGHG